MKCPVDEELAALADGDVTDARMWELRRHVAECPRCRALLEAIGRSDEELASAAAACPPPAAVLATRRAIEPILRPPPSEVMTLEQVAEFLQVEAGELGPIVEELPAFELAGRVRVRRSSLLEWIRRREDAFQRQSAVRGACAPGGALEGAAL